MKHYDIKRALAKTTENSGPVLQHTTPRYGMLYLPNARAQKT